MGMNIEEYIMSKEWKFAELLQLTETSRRVAEELYDEISIKDMINNLWDKKIDAEAIHERASFGQLYKHMTMEYLTREVMDAFKKYFESATVNFEAPTQERLTQDSINEAELPIPPKPKTINKKLNTDGTSLPPGVERI